MIKLPKLLDRIIQGHYHNISFDDFIRLIELTGFVYLHTTGSHMLFDHPKYRILLNIQPDRNKNAKPAQVRELKEFIITYNIKVGE